MLYGRLPFKSKMKNILLTVIILIGISALGQDAPFTVVVVDFKEKPIEGEQILFRGIKE